MNVRLPRQEEGASEHRRATGPTVDRIKAHYSSYLVSLRQTARLHWEATAITGLTLIIAIVLVLVYVTGKTLLILPVMVASILLSVALIYTVTAAIWYFFYMLCVARPSSPMRFLIERSRAFVADQERAASCIYVAVLFSIFAAAFSLNKAMISKINPFAWDERLSQLDSALFFGSYPHEYLGWIFSTPLSAVFMETIYQVWYYVFYLSIVVAGYYLANTRQARIYLLASVLCWFVGGNVLALVFSSAGPVFEEIHGMGIYEDHRAKILAATPIIGSFSDVVRDRLLFAYSNHGASSISAFPSMHVGSTVLVTMLAWQGGVMVRVISLLFLGAVIVGSVALLWHYAVDSVAGLIVGLVCWFVAARTIDQGDRRLMQAHAR